MYIDKHCKRGEGSDLLFCEGMFDEAMRIKRKKKHMTANKLQNSKGCAIGKLALIHYSPRYTDYELKTL